MKKPPLLDGTVLSKDPEALHAHTRDYGYLYLPKFFKRIEIETLANQVLSLASQHGILDSARPFTDAMVPPGKAVFEEDTPAWLAFYREVLKLRALNLIAVQSQVIDLIARITSEPVFGHPRINVRFYANFPVEFASPPHRDFTWVGGSANTWTAWVPLLPTPKALGGLELVPASHRVNYEPKEDGESNELLSLAQEWHTNDYDVGDLVVFHSKIVHAGGGNHLENRLRVSVEARFQPIAEPIREDCLEPHWHHLGLVTWEDIYRDWPEDCTAKHFWKRLPLQITRATDGSYLQSRRKRYLGNVLRLNAAQGKREEGS